MYNENYCNNFFSFFNEIKYFRIFKLWSKMFKKGAKKTNKGDKKDRRGLFKGCVR